MSHVVVFLPGIMGSVLKLGAEVVWPGPAISLALPYNKMRELLDPNLVATDCIRSFVLPQYQNLIDDLAICGFDKASHTLVIAAYDWRKSIENSADTMAQRLAEVIQQHGNQVEISLVAHSMGGLVARHFLESGRFASAPGFANVRNLITLATPHRGAAIALPLVLGFEKKLFLSKDQVLLLASDPRYPGAYELLPRRGEPVVWDASGQGLVPVLDIYEQTIAQRLQLVPQNLTAAAAFHTSLDNGKRPPHVRYFCFSGNRQTTASYVRLQPRGGNRLAPAKVDQEDAGDGTVPIWSSTLFQTQFLYVAGEHGTIYKTRELRQTLATLLGRAGVLAAGTATEIALRETVVEPGAFVHATLKLSSETTELVGKIVVEALVIDPAGLVSATRPIASHAMQYEGPVIETISTVFEAPNVRGHYQVSFYSTSAVQPSASVELIVQEPAPGGS